ncbi:MAG TPA: class I SAM-dependent methyltransferase [Actinomycetes bacterium]|jgi:SAM-dependent methyltransferase|nr:class I SAM-dependent methyltransferase [Actinomycetes bacterium]
MEPLRRPNEDQAQYWNGPEAGHWLVHEHRYERMLAPFTRVVLGAAAVTRTDRVVDIGCGTGSTTCAAARAACDGQALGVDISAPLLQWAKQRAQQDGLTNVCFEHGDAQTHRLAPGGFDVAISRFGVMFFSDPPAAFANIARGPRPGGRLVFVCWQNLVANEWITVPGLAAAQLVPLPPLDDPGNPGPFSLGDRHRLEAILDAAGLVDAAIEPVAEPLWLGRDVVDTVEFFKATGIGKTLLQGVDAVTASRVTEALQAALEPHLTSDGVWLGSQAWLVTARTPR